MCNYWRVCCRWRLPPTLSLWLWSFLMVFAAQLELETVSVQSSFRFYFVFFVKAMAMFRLNYEHRCRVRKFEAFTLSDHFIGQYLDKMSNKFWKISHKIQIYDCELIHRYWCAGAMCEITIFDDLDDNVRPIFFSFSILAPTFGCTDEFHGRRSPPHAN